MEHFSMRLSRSYRLGHDAKGRQALPIWRVAPVAPQYRLQFQPIHFITTQFCSWFYVQLDVAHRLLSKKLQLDLCCFYLFDCHPLSHAGRAGDRQNAWRQSIPELVVQHCSVIDRCGFRRSCATATCLAHSLLRLHLFDYLILEKISSRARR